MSRQQPRSQGTSTQATTTRQNEYFVPRDGIDREVISADICRYLGNDALVRPGHYEVWRVFLSLRILDFHLLIRIDSNRIPKPVRSFKATISLHTEI